MPILSRASRHADEVWELPDKKPNERRQRQKQEQEDQSELEWLRNDKHVHLGNRAAYDPEDDVAQEQTDHDRSAYSERNCKDFTR